MGFIAKKKVSFLRQIRQKAWAILENICIFLKKFENFFGQTREIFFLLGQGPKISVLDLGQVATIHGTYYKLVYFFHFVFGSQNGI
jgi:hypothetical protein